MTPHGAVEILAKALAAVEEEGYHSVSEIAEIEDGIGAHIVTPSGDKWFLVVKWDRSGSP